MSRAEFAKELVAYGSSFFRKFVISVLHHIFSRKLSPIIDDSTHLHFMISIFAFSPPCFVLFRTFWNKRRALIRQMSQIIIYRLKFLLKSDKLPSIPYVLKET